jgi:protein-S-isoprenylcysteine O-methyltransferase Ste14
MEVAMSSEEKRTWVSALVGLVVPLGYLAYILPKVADTDVEQIAYVRPMLVAIGVGIVAGIVLSIVAAIALPGEADRTDERDREIHRRGEFVGFYVMSIAALLPLGLAMAEAEHFWIANTLYLSFVLAALASAVVKIVAYRRGY